MLGAALFLATLGVGGQPTPSRKPALELRKGLPPGWVSFGVTAADFILIQYQDSVSGAIAMGGSGCFAERQTVPRDPSETVERQVSGDVSYEVLYVPDNVRQYSTGNTKRVRPPDGSPTPGIRASVECSQLGGRSESTKATMLS